MFGQCQYSETCLYSYFIFFNLKKIIFFLNNGIRLYTDKQTSPSHGTPSREGGRVGRRCSHKQALPRHRAMASRPKRCLEELEESVVPTLSAMALPMEQTV